LAFGFWLLAFGFWLLAFGFWLLAFGFWLLAFGFWLYNGVRKDTKYLVTSIQSPVVGQVVGHQSLVVGHRLDCL
jgi:hypothetical protein